MRSIAAAFLLTFGASTAIGAPVSRNAREPASDFAVRVGPPQGEIAHPVIETSEWSPGNKAILAFVRHPYPPPNDDPDLFGKLVTAYMLVPTSPGNYERVELDTYGPEGGSAEVESVFFEKASPSGPRSMFVLVSWPGGLFRTFAYAYGPDHRAIFQEALSLQIDGGCVYSRKEHKSAAEIRATVRAIVARQSAGTSSPSPQDCSSRGLSEPEMAQSEPGNDVPTLCRSDEFTYLTARVHADKSSATSPSSSSTIISLCADRPSEPFGRFVYRSGSPGHIETERTATASEPFNLFWWSDPPTFNEMVSFSAGALTYCITEAKSLGHGVHLAVFKSDQPVFRGFSGLEMGTNYRSGEVQIDFYSASSPVFQLRQSPLCED